MSDIQRIESGTRMSDAVIYEGKVYLSGVVADQAAGLSVYEQTVDILAQIDALLARAGSHKTRILKANIWLSDITKFSEMNRAWDAWAIAGQTPARATVEARLATPDYAVEIMVEAVVA
ncbi:MAG: RidA family protein [Rickettsiales bacterium]|nr:RidA family protein [Rickettsiales bacterium]